MDSKPIQPDKVTKPIQLLAAWLAGLILTDGAFLSSAALINRPDWAAGALVIAAIINVPLFLASLFLLQTKFRPEMQEDVYYARHLERVYSSQTRETEILVTTPPQQTVTHARAANVVRKERSKLNEVSISINDLIPDYTAILGELTVKGIVPDNTFGTSSTKPATPKPFVVSVGPSVPAELVKKIVEVASKYGLDGIALAGKGAEDPLEKAMHERRVYIGSYRNRPGEFVPFTAEVAKKIGSRGFDEEALNQILRN